MEWFLIVVVAGGAGLAVTAWRARQRAPAEELDVVRRLTDQDVAHLRGLIDSMVGDHDLDEGMRDALRVAVESFESARAGISKITSAEAVGPVVATIAAGHHALACVQALQAGRPAPEPRVMCFFDPRHGPSTTDVLWSRPGHGQRRVPACAQDAQRVADKVAPDVRTATTGSRSLPYWAVGGAVRAYTKGYFAGVATLSWAYEPGGADAAAGREPPGSFGSGIVGSSGHFDGGGFDGSGAV